MTKQIARTLRKNPTDAEQELWKRLRRRQVYGHKFRRQFPIGGYVLDFVCLEKKLAVELDGGQHAKRKEYDESRTLWLKAQSYVVLRFWNNQIFREVEGVLEKIGDTLRSTPHPAPPPQGGRVSAAKGHKGG